MDSEARSLPSMPRISLPEELSPKSLSKPILLYSRPKAGCELLWPHYGGLSGLFNHKVYLHSPGWLWTLCPPASTPSAWIIGMYHAQLPKKITYSSGFCKCTRWSFPLEDTEKLLRIFCSSSLLAAVDVMFEETRRREPTDGQGSSVHKIRLSGYDPAASWRTAYICRACPGHHLTLRCSMLIVQWQLHNRSHPDGKGACAGI